MITSPALFGAQESQLPEGGISRQLVKDFLEGTRVKRDANPTSLTSLDAEFSRLIKRIWDYKDEKRGIKKVTDVEIQQIIVGGNAYRIDTHSEILRIINDHNLKDLKAVQLVVKINGVHVLMFPESKEVSTGTPTQQGQVSAPESLSEYIGYSLVQKSNKGSNSGVELGTANENKSYDLGRVANSLETGMVIVGFEGKTVLNKKQLDDLFKDFVKGEDRTSFKLTVITGTGERKNIDVPVVWGKRSTGTTAPTPEPAQRRTEVRGTGTR
jgi:hypothetical protein